MLRLWVFALCALHLAAADAGWVGSTVCGKCHADIYRKYSSTPMALSSGLAGSGPVREQSFSGNSGYKYSVVRQNQRLFLNFAKGGAKNSESRELAYFVGSGAVAISYLIAVGAFLYEAPATYYSRTGGWALSPGYDRYSHPFLTRAIAPGCLLCHASSVQPIGGTQNGYRSPPFLEGGVDCERCHGPGAAHAASGKAKDIVNPASLPAEQRDSVCAQCHLAGEIRVDRAGKSMTGFIAGDKLSDYVVAFVRTGPATGMKVTGHVEKLAQSGCSRGSGDRLWCGTCHDPHFVPSPTEKAAWFRSKCQTCHAPSVCRRGDDCVACHMPAGAVTDAQHVVYTDHSIPRRPVSPARTNRNDAPLVAIRGTPASSRDLGLAYAIVALREQNAAYSARAFDLLREAERQSPDDPQTLSYLADLYKTRKDDRNAFRLYQRLYTVDPTQSSAPMNLGAYQMEQGRDEDAIRLFRQALKISPALVLVRLNLAVALIRTGRSQEARPILEDALKFDPSLTAARDLLNKIP
jgi:Tetratricopeptide repeat/Cytochrome c554 and c-prime